MKRKIKIGFDFDNVMNNLIDVWICECNKLVPKDDKIKEAEYWEIEQCYPFLGEAAILPLYRSDFWTKVKPKEGAVESIKKLIDEGHDIFVITNTTFNIERKFSDCLFEHFPFLTWDNLILTKRKDIVNVDILVDDYPPNLEGSKASLRLLYDYPYNRKYQIEHKQDSNLFVVHNWKEIMNTIKILAN